MKNRLILSAAANVLAIIFAVALPAGAGVSIDRMSPSTNVACGANPAQVFNLVPPGGGCDAAGFPMLEVAPVPHSSSSPRPRRSASWWATRSTPW